MSGSARTLPTSVLVAVALVLLGLGATWWQATRPAVGTASTAAVHRAQAPVGSIVVLRLDDGRILKYESDGSAPPTSWHRRCSGLRPAFVRTGGQGNLAHC